MVSPKNVTIVNDYIEESRESFNRQEDGCFFSLFRIALTSPLEVEAFFIDRTFKKLRLKFHFPIELETKPNDDCRDGSGKVFGQSFRKRRKKKEKKKVFRRRVNLAGVIFY